jgi:hypothetical protein
LEIVEQFSDRFASEVTTDLFHKQVRMERFFEAKRGKGEGKCCG